MTAHVARTPAWRGLMWNTWRQHRLALLAMAAPIVLAALIMAFTGPTMHEALDRSPFPGLDLPESLGNIVALVEGLMLVSPLLAGIFLGAPLIASNAEHRTTQLIWTQTVGRVKWFVAQVVPTAGMLAIAGAGLGIELRWWVYFRRVEWSALTFTVGPLSLAGWMVAGFSIGVLLGALVRRTVPAMAATVLCSAVIYSLVSGRLRNYYLPPLRVGVPWIRATGRPVGFLVRGWIPGSDLISSVPGFPDGRPLTESGVFRTRTWYVAHHIKIWTTFQPASRRGLFELIEFGLLVALSVLLLGAAMTAIRRRPA